MKKIYSIGYSGIVIEDFIKILKKNEINCVIDVRSIPYGKYTPDYNKENIKEKLKKNGILYENFSKEFGARRNEENVYDSDGKVNFLKVSKCENFKKGVDRIKKGVEKYSIVLMCSEKNPIECHRFSLVSRFITEEGFEVIHILNDGNLQKQCDLEKIMVNKYGPEHSQYALFSQTVCTYEDALKKAYDIISNKVAYEEEKEEE